MKKLKALVEAVRNIEKAQKHPVDKSDNSSFKDLKSIFEKSLAINKDLKSGQVIEFSDLEAKKPANLGIKASSFQRCARKTNFKRYETMGFFNNRRY